MQKRRPKILIGDLYKDRETKRLAKVIEVREDYIVVKGIRSEFNVRRDMFGAFFSKSRNQKPL